MNKTVLKLALRALESCNDNYGSEAADNGCYEKYFDDKLVEKAKKGIKKELDNQKGRNK